MSIVTISRGSYSRGKEVAEKLARALNYECISREIILEASEHFNIPELKLVRAIHDAPTILDRFTSGKERFVAFFRAALLTHLATGQRRISRTGGPFFSAADFSRSQDQNQWGPGGPGARRDETRRHLCRRGAHGAGQR